MTALFPSKNEKKLSEKSKTMRLSVIFCLFCLPFFTQAQTSITITNYSQWNIYHIYLAPENTNTWSNDLLSLNEGISVDPFLTTDKSIVHNLTSEGNWQVKIVDEDGDECIIPHSYFSSQYVLEIFDDILIECFYSN